MPSKNPNIDNLIVAYAKKFARASDIELGNPEGFSVPAGKPTSRNELVSLLNSHKGESPIHFISHTAVTKLNSAGKKRFGGMVTKLSHVKGFINRDYEKAAREAAAKAGVEYKPGSTWHTASTHLSGQNAPFSLHDDGVHYLRIMNHEQVGRPRYFDKDGQELNANEVERFVKKQNQLVPFSVYSINSLRHVIFNGKHHQITSGKVNQDYSPNNVKETPEPAVDNRDPVKRNIQQPAQPSAQLPVNVPAKTQQPLSDKIKSYRDKNLTKRPTWHPEDKDLVTPPNEVKFQPGMEPPANQSPAPAAAPVKPGSSIFEDADTVISPKPSVSPASESPVKSEVPEDSVSVEPDLPAEPPAAEPTSAFNLPKVKPIGQSENIKKSHLYQGVDENIAGTRLAHHLRMIEKKYWGFTALTPLIHQALSGQWKGNDPFAKIGQFLESRDDKEFGDAYRWGNVSKGLGTDMKVKNFIKGKTKNENPFKVVAGLLMNQRDGKPVPDWAQKPRVQEFINNLRQESKTDINGLIRSLIRNSWRQDEQKELQRKGARIDHGVFDLLPGIVGDKRKPVTAERFSKNKKFAKEPQQVIDQSAKPTDAAKIETVKPTPHPREVFRTASPVLYKHILAIAQSRHPTNSLNERSLSALASDALRGDHSALRNLKMKIREASPGNMLGFHPGFHDVGAVFAKNNAANRTVIPLPVEEQQPFEERPVEKKEKPEKFAKHGESTNLQNAKPVVSENTDRMIDAIHEAKTYHFGQQAVENWENLVGQQAVENWENLANRQDSQFFDNEQSDFAKGLHLKLADHLQQHGLHGLAEAIRIHHNPEDERKVSYFHPDYVGSGHVVMATGPSEVGHITRRLAASVAKVVEGKNGRPLYSIGVHGVNSDGGINNGEFASFNTDDHEVAKGVVRDIRRARAARPARPQQMSKSHKFSDPHNNSFAGALRDLYTKQQQIRREIAGRILNQSGLSPNKLSDALHDVPHLSKPGVAQAIFKPVSRDHSIAAAAKYGLESGQDSLLVFHGDPNGPDSLYAFDVPGGEDGRKLLDSAGLDRRTLIPHNNGFRVVIHDQGDQYRDKVQNLADQLNATVTESRGSGDYIGADTSSAAREQYRSIIRGSGSSAAASTGSTAAQNPVSQESVQTGQQQQQPNPAASATGPIRQSKSNESVNQSVKFSRGDSHINRGYDVHLVNGDKVRASSLEADDFTDWGIHEDFPKLIGRNQIWIDDDNSPEDVKIMAAMASARLDYLKEGKSSEEAYKLCLHKAKGMKARQDGHSSEDSEKIGSLRHEDVDKKIYVKKIFDCPGLKLSVWLVDGDRVRNKTKKKDFTEGGNWKVYGFIPHGEVWVERKMRSDGMEKTILHEFTETNEMEHGKTYAQAHEISLAVDFKFSDKFDMDKLARFNPKVLEKLVKDSQKNGGQEDGLGNRLSGDGKYKDNKSSKKFSKTYNDVFKAAAAKHFGAAPFMEKLAKLTPEEQQKHQESLKSFVNHDLIGVVKKVARGDEDLSHDIATKILFGNGNDPPAFFTKYDPKQANLLPRFATFARGYSQHAYRKNKNQAAPLSTLGVDSEHLEATQPSSLRGGAQQATPSGLSEEMENLVGQLGGWKEKLVRQFYVERLPIKQIAAIEGIPEGSIKRKLSEARDSLRAIAQVQKQRETAFA
jgi:hypothetical protein